MQNPFPRGFLLSKNEISPPLGFRTGPLIPNLFVSPDCRVDSAALDSFAVVVLGTCVPADSAPRLFRFPRRAVDHFLEALHFSEAEFFDTLDRYCGRHAVIYRIGHDTRILTDATGMRTVFYSIDGNVLASHAKLAERALDGTVRRRGLPYAYGYPGDWTPYRRTKLLTPNTLFDLATGEVRRFWPRGPIAPLSVDEATDHVINYVSNSLRHIRKYGPLALSLTAGLDSRTTFAIALAAKIRFQAYTYRKSSTKRSDIAIAKKLAKLRGVKHFIVDARNVATPPDLRELIMEATYYNHHRSAVHPMALHFGTSGTIAVTSNLLEIGRAFYRATWPGRPAPDTAEKMAWLYYDSFRAASKQTAAQYGLNRFLAETTEAFSEFLFDSKFNAGRGIVDAHDQFYWEHRMSAWHAMILLERDFYADCFIPFNSRLVLKTLLGAADADRATSKVFYAIIARCAPDLLQVRFSSPAKRTSSSPEG